MLISNYKVFVTKNGDGAITYTRNDVNYRVYISKENKVLFDIFNQHFKRLESFKHRHYAIAQDIARDIRKNGYYFKSYANNHTHIRPILKSEVIKQIKKPTLMDLESLYFHQYTSEMYRLIH